MTRLPIVNERVHFLEGDTFRPVICGLAFGPACLSQTLFQIINHALRRVIGERYDLFALLHLGYANFDTAWSTGATESFFLRFATNAQSLFRHSSFLAPKFRIKAVLWPHRSANPSFIHSAIARTSTGWKR